MEWLEHGVLHVWLFALIIAALAPWCVQLFARAIERRQKSTTEATIARALALHDAKNATSIEPREASSNVSKPEGS